MKTLSFFFLSFSLFLTYSNGAFSFGGTVPACESPPQTKKEAKECAEMLIGSKAEELYDFVSGKNHLGNIEACTSTSSDESKSYFTNNAADFTGGMRNANIQNCAVSRRDDDAFACWLTDGPQGCHIKRGQKGEVSTRACLMLGKSTGELITLYPAECD